MESFFNDLSALAVILGAPEEYDVRHAILCSDTLDIASAFGHMSGWLRIEKSILKSQGHVRVLLGQAFFQTEPELLFRLKNLCQQHPRIQARLASATQTFHAKVWLINEAKGCHAVVGSSNLSSGGLRNNVECNLYVNKSDVVCELKAWYELQWKAGLSLEGSFLDRYLAKYDLLKATRLLLRKQLEVGTDEIVYSEVLWRKREALAEAERFWKTKDGLVEVDSRVNAIKDMQETLRVPAFNFGPTEYEHFIRVPELGRIRLAFVTKTVADFSTLKAGLNKLVAEQSPKVIDDLLRTKGVGPNVASKLMALSDPDRFFVINAPVSRALASFGYPVDQLENIDAEKYRGFLKELEPFKEAAQIANLQPAAALDAFFYEYRGYALD
jgi:HKD family nuclease